MEHWESDRIVEKWLQENDDDVMPLPTVESSPHLLISKVRKYYMEYLIKLLSVNYENHQKLLNKNIYLPSAIWRCAKIIEMSAARASMVVQIYRQSITNVINDLKNKTKKGRLYRKLYECLHYSPENEKKTQVSLESNFNNCNCQCYCNQRKKIKRQSRSPYSEIKDSNHSNYKKESSNPTHIDIIPQKDLNESQITTVQTSPPKTKDQASENSANSDELMHQLEKLFEGDPNDDDLFDGAFSSADHCELKSKESSQVINNENQVVTKCQEMGNVNQEVPKKCLDERLSLFTGFLESNDSNFQDCHTATNKIKKNRQSKWLCEEYFQRAKLFELLDQIRYRDRNKFTRIKEMMCDLFGEDDDNDDVVLSPLEESPEFIMSCKQRITPWVVKILSPYYVKGRIRGKTLFKSLAKHLITLIYQCSKYPYEYEVLSFINDFLSTHPLIRCEADFKEFRIENI